MYHHQRHSLIISLSAVLTGVAILTGVGIHLVLKSLEAPVVNTASVTTSESLVAIKSPQLLSTVKQDLTSPTIPLKSAKQDLRNSNLAQKDLRAMNLSHADLRNANLTEANLEGVDLSEADLVGANLSKANLSQTNLNGANLKTANLSQANLRNAKLSHTDLSFANLSHAELSGTIGISEAILTGADLAGAMPNGNK